MGTGCLTAPMIQNPNQLGQLDLSPRNPDHGAIVELTKFVRDHLALDVQANRRFSKRSNNQTEDIANAIIQHVNDLNRNTTTKFEEVLQKLAKLEKEKEELQTVVEEMHDSYNALKRLVAPDHTDNLEVKMPVPESELLFPKTTFFKLTPRGSSSVLRPDPLDPHDTLPSLRVHSLGSRYGPNRPIRPPSVF